MGPYLLAEGMVKIMPKASFYFLCVPEVHMLMEPVKA